MILIVRRVNEGILDRGGMIVGSNSRISIVLNNINPNSFYGGLICN